MTPNEAVEHIIRTNPAFAVGEEDIRGVRQRVFTHAPDNLRKLLEQSASACILGRALLVYQEERWSHADLCADVKRLANALASELGVRQGDKVALLLRNYPETVVLLHAVAALGAVVVPMNTWWSSVELEYGLKDCGAKLVFVDKQSQQRITPFADRLDVAVVGVRDADARWHYDGLRRCGVASHWPAVTIRPDDDFAVFYSSGSTGKPKGVVLTHRSAISAVYSFALARTIPRLLEDSVPAEPDLPAIMLAATPLFHVTALQSLVLTGMVLGATIVLMYKWDADEAVRIIEREKVTHFTGVPTQSMDLLEAAKRKGASLASLQRLAAGGAKRPAVQVEVLARAFPGAALATGWGLTETNALGTSMGGEEYVANPDAIGRAVPPIQEVRIVDEAGNSLPAGKVGELVTKGPNVMRCYLNLPDETARSLRDGWFYTGDLGYKDRNDLFYIVDRKKDIILRGGENVACLEVEEVLYKHPAVMEACAFAIPHERLGETVGACVQFSPDSVIKEEALRAFLADRLAQFKVPERIWFHDAPLPRIGTDKIDRRALREQYADS